MVEDFSILFSSLYLLTSIVPIILKLLLYTQNVNEKKIQYLYDR